MHEKSRRVGIDLTSSRIRTVVCGAGPDRPLVLDAPAIDLALAVHLDRKPLDVGQVGYTSIRRAPHHVAINFLPHVTESKAWKAGRQTLSADAALGVAFAKIAPSVSNEAEAIGLAVPAYLTPPQAAACAGTAAANKLPIAGTVQAALAVVAERTETILRGDPASEEADGDRPAGIVPIRNHADGPGSAVVIDVDDHALSASVVWVDRGETRLLMSASWPKLSKRAWRDRLIDAVSDRCVRLCRRDPRDSADAEQSLFEQLENAVEHAASNRAVAFHLRAAHWYQDLVLQPPDLDAVCVPLVNQLIHSLTELIYSSGVPAPPRAIWSTVAASHLPGLAQAIYENSAESTTVSTLPIDAIAAAAARLAPRWLSGELPRTHLDAVLPFAPAMPALAAREGVTAKRG
ncbi:MAG: hypothetical protein U0798_13090 [Gemmataceae bacterium]